MARRAPAVERSIAVLNFLAAHPDDRYTLSEIARATDLNKATLHAILGALTESGFVLREEEKKTYGLGPALVALGGAAVEANPAVQLAVPQMQGLSDDLGLDCVASTAIEDQIVILTRTSSARRPFGIDVQPGQRLPLAPPLGTVFVAWSSDEEIDHWLALVGPSASKADLTRYREAVETVRARGYSLGLGGEPVRAEESAAQRRRRRTLEENVRTIRVDEYALIELDHSSAYRLNHIGAPVFGPNGRVTLAVFLIGFQGDIAAAEVPRYAERLMEACSRVTKAIHGKPPAAA
ncbi:MAG: helix-turn-helix domain-containing protein [Actinomycetota bacterium]